MIGIGFVVVGLGDSLAGDGSSELSSLVSAFLYPLQEILNVHLLIYN